MSLGSVSDCNPYEVSRQAGFTDGCFSVGSEWQILKLCPHLHETPPILVWDAHVLHISYSHSEVWLHEAVAIHSSIRGSQIRVECSHRKRGLTFGLKLSFCYNATRYHVYADELLPF